MSFQRFLRLSVSSAACILIAGAISSASAQNARPQRVFGNPDAPQYAPNRTYHVENYKITGRIDMDKGEISGEVVVSLHPLLPGFKAFYLNSAQLTIDSVALLSDKGAAMPLTFRSEDPKLWITLDHEHAPAELLKVRVKYHGNPEARPAPDAGLSFIRPDAAMPKRPLEVWSYGWPENNHYWFPCWDYPNDKATSEVILTVPEPLYAVSNGELVKAEHHGKEATFDWVEHVPHSAYLISIAVGPWTKYSQTYKGKPVEYYVPSGTDEATAMRSFGLTPDMMGFYSTIFGTEYPYEKYAMTADHNFGGGTENISATSLAETTLHDARAEQDYSSIDLVSHELMHQWFGDLVTEYSWDEAWLSEGFATYGAALYRSHHNGDDAFRYQIFQDQQTAMREDTTRYRRPLVDRHYLKPWDILDRTTYQKGSSVLDMLRYVVNGEVESLPSAQEPYFKVMHNYLTAYHAKNVDTQNLIDAIRGTTGMELNWFFDEWVHHGGYPQYEVSSTYDAAKHAALVTVKQTQTVDAVTPLFDMPVQLAFFDANGGHQETLVRVRQKEETFTVPVNFQPQWTDFDPHGHIYKTLKVDEPVEALVARAEHDPNMVSRLWATKELAKVGDSSKGVAITALTNVLEKDSFYAIRTSAATALGDLGGEAAKRTLVAALKQPDSHVRTAALNSLDHYAQDGSIYADLVNVLHNDQSYAAQSAAAQVLGDTGKPQAFEELEKEVAKKPSPHEMTGLVAAIAKFKTPRAQEILTDLSKTADTDEVRESAKRALTGGGGRRR